MTGRTISASVAGAICFAVAMTSTHAEERSLTLGEAISTALSNNPAIVGAREQMNAAGFRVEEARAGFLPQASASAGYKRSTANSASPPYMPSSTGAASFKSLISRDNMDSYNNWSASVAITQNVWDFGKTLGAYDSAKAQKQASGADLAATVEGVHLNVALAFFAALATRETVEAAAQTLRQMEKHVEVARAQVTAGIRPSIDVTRAQSDLASARLALLRAENAVRVARVNLNAAMGVAGETTYRCQAPPPAPEIAIPDVDAAVRDAIARRPERASLVQKVKAAEGTRTVAMSGWYPTIGANAGLAYTGYKVDDMVYNWNLGATVTWNFFSGLYTRAAVREAEANLAALRASLASLDLSIRSEVESAAIAYREARERIAPARALLASAAETLELAEGRYAAGAGNIVEVTDATAVKTQADVGLIQAQYDIESARVRLLKVLGVLVPRADGHSPGKED